MHPAADYLIQFTSDIRFTKGVEIILRIWHETSMFSFWTLAENTSHLPRKKRRISNSWITFCPWNLRKLVLLTIIWKFCVAPLPVDFVPSFLTRGSPYETSTALWIIHIFLASIDRLFRWCKAFLIADKSAYRQ